VDRTLHRGDSFNTTMVDEGLKQLEGACRKAIGFNTTMVDEGPDCFLFFYRGLFEFQYHHGRRGTDTLRNIRARNPSGFNTTMVDEGLPSTSKCMNSSISFNTTMVDEKGENNDERSL